MAFDFSTNIQAPNFASAFQNTGKGIEKLGSNLGQAFQTLIQQKKDQEKQKQWQTAINQMVAQNPKLAPYAQMFGQDPALAGQLLPGLLKSEQVKPTQSIWRNAAGEASLEPKTEPGWKEYTGFNPQQAQSTFNQSIGSQARKEWAQQLKSRTEMGYVQNIYNDMNTLNKSSGGVLGQAAQIQYRSQRGEHLLNTPGIANDKLVYGLVKADLAAIAQGGSPTIAAQAEASLPTIKEEANGLLRRITANPKDIDQPEVKEQMRKIFQVMDKSASSIFDQNTQGLRTLYSSTDWFKEHPDIFDKAAQYLGQGIKPFDPRTLPPLPPPINEVPEYQETAPVGDQ